jgi:hypothetical protein
LPQGLHDVASVAVRQRRAPSGDLGGKQLGDGERAEGGNRLLQLLAQLYDRRRVGLVLLEVEIDELSEGRIGALASAAPSASERLV